MLLLCVVVKVKSANDDRICEAVDGRCAALHVHGLQSTRLGLNWLDVDVWQIFDSRFFNDANVERWQVDQESLLNLKELQVREISKLSQASRPVT